MKNIQPYEPTSVRTPRLWGKAAAAIGVHPIVLQDVYIDRYCTGMGADDFRHIIEKGPGKKKKNIFYHDNTKFIAGVLELCKSEKYQYSEQELADKQAKRMEGWKEDDFDALLHYRLKEIIEVGDEWRSDEDKEFTFSEKRYITKGKHYRILSLKDEGGYRFGFTTETDIPSETNYGSVYSCRSIWRDGKEIWNWERAYWALWLEQNPDDAEKPEVLKRLAELEAQPAEQMVELDDSET